MGYDSREVRAFLDKKSIPFESVELVTNGVQNRNYQNKLKDWIIIQVNWDISKIYMTLILNFIILKID